jgi:hypothetical protein
MTQIFETKKIRVQIVNKSAWVETRDGSAWRFRSQHNLPISLSIVRGRSSISVLRAAVTHYEQTQDGDQALRAALTGSVIRQRPAASSVAADTPIPAVQDLPVSRGAIQGSRGPLYPPLLRLGVGFATKGVAKISSSAIFTRVIPAQSLTAPGAGRAHPNP